MEKILHTEEILTHIICNCSLLLSELNPTDLEEVTADLLVAAREFSFQLRNQNKKGLPLAIEFINPRMKKIKWTQLQMASQKNSRDSARF